MSSSSTLRRRVRRHEDCPPFPPRPPHHQRPPQQPLHHHHGPLPPRSQHAYHELLWRPAPQPSQQQPPAMTGPSPEFVKCSRRLKNNFDVLKDTIRLVPDAKDPERSLVSFTFDAVTDGCLTIHYFAKEGHFCTHSSVLYPDLIPIKIPFQKGMTQKYVQPYGSGINLDIFPPDELSNSKEEVFPLVVLANTYASPEEDDEPVIFIQSLFLLAVIEKHSDGLQVKVMKKILATAEGRYELEDFYGFVNSKENDTADTDNDGLEKFCVICLMVPRVIALFPCRHVCMCNPCARAFRLKSNKCPVCREPVVDLLDVEGGSTET